jgi:hypothetical protein
VFLLKHRFKNRFKKPVSLRNTIKPEIQLIKGAGSVHNSPECKHSLVSPYSMPLDEEFFDLCLQWPLEMLPFSPAQYSYTNTRPFSTLLTGQLHEVLQCLTVKASQLPLLTTVVPTHINIIILRRETSVAF